MSIQNIEQLSVRIGVATDQLEDAVTSVKAAEGTVIDGSGAAAASAREAAASATQSAFSATQSASSATTSGNAASSARGSANQAISQVELARAEVSKATVQADLASVSAAEAAQSALDIKNFTPTLPDGLVTDAPRDNSLYGRIDGAWALVPTGGGGSGGSGTGSVNSVNGIAPDASGNVSVPIPQPDAQIKSDWNATSGAAQILNKPAIFNGSYSALTGKPALFDGNYLSLTNKPTLFSGDYRELTNKPFIPASFSGSYLDLTNKPILFSGDYNDLVNKPVLNGSGETVDGLGDAPEDGKWYTRKDGQWQEMVAGVAFSGDYRDLTNKPPLNTDGSVGGGSGFNGDYNNLVNKPPLITSNSQLFNGNQYVAEAPYDGGEYYRKNGKWYSADVNTKEYYVPVAAHDTVNLFATPGNPLRGLFLNSTARGWHDHPDKRYGYIHYTKRRSPNPFVPQRLSELTYMNWLDGTGGYRVLNGVDILKYNAVSRATALPSGLYSFGLYEWGDDSPLNEFIGYIEIHRIPYGQDFADGSYEFSGYANDPFLRGGADETDYASAPFSDEKEPNGDRITRNVDLKYFASTGMTTVITIHAVETGKFGQDSDGNTLNRGHVVASYQMDFVTGGLTLMSGGSQGVIDAPFDYKTYVRKNQKWVEADIPRDTLDLTNGAEFVSNPPADGKKYFRTSTGWSEVTYIPQAGAFPVVHNNKLFYQTQLFSYWQGLNPNAPVNVESLEAILGGVTYPRAAKGDVFTVEGIELLPNGRYYFNSGDFKSPSALYNKTGYIEVVKIPSGNINPPTIEVKAYVMGISTWKPAAVYYFSKITGLWTLPDEVPSTAIVNKRTGTTFEEWIGTQAQYDAITTKDPNVRYWITEV